jgi:hypothetical protein
VGRDRGIFARAENSAPKQGRFQSRVLACPSVFFVDGVLGELDRRHRIGGLYGWDLNPL